jgi:hypothetical protein
MGYMCSDGIVGDMKLLRNLVVIHTLADQFGDLNLPVCQMKTFSDIVPLSRTEHKNIIKDDVQKSLFIFVFLRQILYKHQRAGLDRLREV